MEVRTKTTNQLIFDNLLFPEILKIKEGPFWGKQSQVLKGLRKLYSDEFLMTVSGIKVKTLENLWFEKHKESMDLKARYAAFVPIMKPAMEAGTVDFGHENCDNKKTAKKLTTASLFD